MKTTITFIVQRSGTELSRRFSGDADFFLETDWNEHVEDMVDSIERVTNF